MQRRKDKKNKTKVVIPGIPEQGSTSPLPEVGISQTVPRAPSPPAAHVGLIEQGQRIVVTKKKKWVPFDKEKMVASSRPVTYPVFRNPMPPQEVGRYKTQVAQNEKDSVTAGPSVLPLAHTTTMGGHFPPLSVTMLPPYDNKENKKGKGGKGKKEKNKSTSLTQEKPAVVPPVPDQSSTVATSNVESNTVEESSPTSLQQNIITTKS